jgi:hypothetical protein
VFVPDGIEALGDDELVALAAHELAHVRAADVLWLRLGALLQALFPWQLWLLPLRARLHLLAELRCDAEAARKIGATALARCLVEVAARRGPLPLALAPGMAGRPSALRLRVEAALAGHWGGNLPRVAAWLLPTLAVATLAAAAPGVRQADRRAGIPSPAVAHAPPPKPGAAGPAGFDAPELAALGAQCADLLAEAEAALAELAAAPQDEATQQLRRRLAAQVAALERAGARLEAALLRAGSRERRAGGPDGPARRTR